MKLQPECVACIIAQVKTVTQMLHLPQMKAEAAIQETYDFLKTANYEGCTPESMGDLWQILLCSIGESDPYAAIKSLCNQEAERLVPSTSEKIAHANDPFGIALKYAVAGNLIDYGLEHPVSIEEQNALIDAIASTDFSIDDSVKLRDALHGAKSLLYLGDNAGEIVFDRLLIEQINEQYPQISVTFVVKGSAVLNDATMRDALEAGLDKVSRVIDNGDYSPGTVLLRSSEAFRHEFAASDVVLSKGQGNFESLNEENKENLFFLFTAKCDTICAAAGVPKLSIVCMKN